MSKRKGKQHGISLNFVFKNESNVSNGSKKACPLKYFFTFSKKLKPTKYTITVKYSQVL